MLVAGISGLTFSYYFSLGHPEFTSTLAGVFLLVVAAVAIRQLKTRPNGFTHDRLIAEQFESLNVENIIVSQTLGTTPHSPTEEFKPGGGDFGGGGSSNKW